MLRMPEKAEERMRVFNHFISKILKLNTLTYPNNFYLSKQMYRKNYRP